MANAYTVTTALNTLPSYYHKVFLERLVPGPIMMDFCQKKPYELHSGNCIASLYRNIQLKRHHMLENLKDLSTSIVIMKGMNNG